MSLESEGSYMTTQEVEQLCRITKASLLYYEKEGLIHPDRKDNNCRDYNDKDIETHIQQYIKRHEVKISFDHQIIPEYAKEWR